MQFYAHTRTVKYLVFYSRFTAPRLRATSGKFSQDNFDIALAKRILDEDHYGMSDVKGNPSCFNM